MMRPIGLFIVPLLAVLLAAVAPAVAVASLGTQAAGVVTVSYNLHRLPTIASNQLAVWIEDNGGKLVKTLFVTWFTGKGGYERRPDCLPLWRKAAGLDGPPTDAVDAVTRATQRPGRQALVWDCTDSAGNPVPPGTYIYKIEGNIFWAKGVLWQGEITVGDRPASSRAVAVYLPSDVRGGDPMLDNVTAEFAPAAVQR
jgi:hypothetical protein